MFCANVPRRLVHCCERIAARSQQAGGGSAIRREELSHDVQPSLPGPCRPTGAAEASQEPRRTELTAAPYPCRLRSREGRRCLAPGRRCRATSAPPLLRRLAASLTTLAAARSNLQYPTLYICIACIATRSLTRARPCSSPRARVEAVGELLPTAELGRELAQHPRAMLFLGVLVGAVAGAGSALPPAGIWPLPKSSTCVAGAGGSLSASFQLTATGAGATADVVVAAVADSSTPCPSTCRTIASRM